MDTTPDSDPETELINKLNEAVWGYKRIQQHIADRFARLSVSKPIERLLLRLPDNSAQVVQVLEQVGNLYRRVEDEIRNYVSSARDFAEENVVAVEGVKQQKYEPEEALANFEESLENLKVSFTRVLQRHASLPQDFKQNLEGTDIAGLLNSQSQNPINPSQANPLAFARQASSTAASMADTRLGKVATGIAVWVTGFLFGSMTYVLSKPGDSEKELQILKNDFTTLEEALQYVDVILDEHMRTLEDTLTKTKGITAQFVNLGMPQRHSGLEKAVDDIYSVSKKLFVVAKEVCELFK